MSHRSVGAKYPVGMTLQMGNASYLTDPPCSLAVAKLIIRTT